MSDTYSTAPPDQPEYPGDQADAPSAPDTKASQQEVNYRAGTPIKNCGLCGHFTGSAGDGANGCEAVDGDISAFGFCDIYVRQPNPFKAQGGGQMMPPPAAAPPMPAMPPSLTIGNKTYGG